MTSSITAAAWRAVCAASGSGRERTTAASAVLGWLREAQFPLSLLGWSLLNPLAMTAVFCLVFSGLMKVSGESMRGAEIKEGILARAEKRRSRATDNG